MIKKIYEINAQIFNKINLFLFYGENEGAKKEKIQELLVNIDKANVRRYEEKEILDQQEIFIEDLVTNSLFNDNKVIIINRVTDKIITILEKISENVNDDLKIILNSGLLEKKSKIRNFFEKSKIFISVAFYQDELRTLSTIAEKFFLENKISISRQDLNLIINKCNGDRGILKNELDKIKFFSIKNKKISSKDILKLTNLIENYGIVELIDNYLAKNRNKTLQILNENNYNSEDCIVIIRTLLFKTKKLLKLSIDYNKTKNMELTIKNSKPPIFWKDKEIVKQQILKWEPEAIKNLIYHINNTELQIKKNINNSLNVTTNFILDEAYKN